MSFHIQFMPLSVFVLFVAFFLLQAFIIMICYNHLGPKLAPKSFVPISFLDAIILVILVKVLFSNGFYARSNP